MTQKIIELGQLPSGVGGDTNRSANVKCNENFAELYESFAELSENKALSGANRDITSLSGLSTPLSVRQGGTGGATAFHARANIGLGTQDVLHIGPIEISAPRPYIDFHYENKQTDYDVRLHNSAPGTLDAIVADGNKLKVNGATVWNDTNGHVKVASLGVGAIGTYGFFLVNTSMTPGTTIQGGNMQYAFVAGNGQVSPTGTWRCMGDTVAGGRTLFQRIL